MKRANGFTVPNLLNIILADDDKDDCLLFEEALNELPVPGNITIVSNGVQLMQLLTEQNKQSWDVLFLDLNMPKKNGYTCLEEIKGNTKIRQLPVVILSTSLQIEVVDLLYKKGADFYIRKPSTFPQLKNVIEQAIMLTANKNIVQISREKFIICGSLELESRS